MIPASGWPIVPLTVKTAPVLVLPPPSIVDHVMLKSAFCARALLPHDNAASMPRTIHNDLKFMIIFPFIKGCQSSHCREWHGTSQPSYRCQARCNDRDG